MGGHTLMAGMGLHLRKTWYYISFKGLVIWEIESYFLFSVTPFLEGWELNTMTNDTSGAVPNQR